MSPSVALESREFLSSCLKAALDDADLVDAISDQALEQGFSALSIGQGLVSVDQLKDRLYLTVEEAKSVLSICTSMVAEANPKHDPLSLHLQATTSGSLAMHLSYKQQQDGIQHVTAAAQEPSIPFEPLDMIMENAAVVVVSRAAPYSSEKKILAAAQPESVMMTLPNVSGPVQPKADDVVLVEDAVVTADQQPTPAAVKSVDIIVPAAPVPKPAPEAKPVDATPVVTPSKPKATDATPQAASPKSATAAAAKPVAKPSNVTPSSLQSKQSAARATELLSPEPSAVSPRVPSSPSSTPSYLKPTAAHKARTSKDADLSASCTLTPVAENSVEQRKRRNLFSRMASTLLAPTQAFVARVTGRHEEIKTKNDVSMTKASIQLEAMLCSPQGQRVTKPQPFALRSEMRVKSSPMTTEELELAEAREKAFKRTPVPKHVYESRPIVPTQRSAPKDPNEVFEPFQLASVELHNKKMEEKRKKAEEEAAREEEARRFKARAFDARIAASPITPPKPPPSPVTKAAAPVFASEARIAHYREVIEPAKKAKEAELNREKLEAERKAKEMEDMNLDDFRKTLEFKARPMPDFSSPFRVDPSMSRPVTSPMEPKLHTVQRLGTVGPREDKEGDGLGNGLYDGAGYVDPFFASLRKTTSVGIGRHGSMSASKSSMASTSKRNAALRQSSIAAFGRNGTTPSPMAGVRGSVGSSFQAAIRAAARDAVRDLHAISVSQLSEEGDASCSGEN